MKRFGLFVLLACMAFGQSLWLVAPEPAYAQTDPVIADEGATQTAEADSAANTAAAGVAQTAAAGQATQAAADAAASAAAAAQTQAAGAVQTQVAADATASAIAAADEDEEPPVEEPSSTPTYKNILPNDWVRISSSAVNVRSAPTTGVGVVAIVRLNQEFKVLEGPITDGTFWWIRIDMGTPNEDPRWIAANYVVRLAGPSGSVDPPASIPSFTPTSTRTVTPIASSTPATYKGIQLGDRVQINANSVNVRNRASTSGTIVAVVQRNQQFTVLQGPVLANGYQWVRIDMGSNVTGERWIAANYVNRLAPVATSTPTRTPSPSNTPTLTPTIDPDASPTNTATITNTPTKTSTPSGTVTPGTYVTSEKIVVTTAVNVRSGAGTNYGIQGVAPRGRQGTVLSGQVVGGSYNWIQVDFGASLTGWVAINYITHLQLTTPTSAPQPWLLQVSIDCYSTPERITLVNSSSVAAEIYSITTHYARTANEPFILNHTLAAKQTRSYLAGTGASGSFALTTSFIFTNSAGSQDGVTIETSFGTITRSCPASSSGERYVVVDLSDQYMTVYQGNVVVAGTYVSTGKPGFATPRGTFRTWVKYVSTRMAACSNGECWDTPNVPFTHYFTYNGHALHGAYWHNQFGQVRSHGCVNLPVPFSEWLYYWLPLNSRVVVQA